MRTEATFLGLVTRVVGAKLMVELSPEIPSANPIINGRMYRLGQVGSFVKIPLGFLSLFGIVSMVGASSIDTGELPPAIAPQGQRWIEVQLVGESYQGEPFQRGISVFPTIDDEVHVVTEDDLSVVYGTRSPSMVEIGNLVASSSLSAAIDVDKLVTRHAAIVGSTGSGKSNAVAGLLKALGGGSYPNLNVVVIDPHGEYGAALQGKARVYSIGDNVHPLIIPYWALSFDELAWFLVDRRSGTETIQDIQLRDYILQKKSEACNTLKAGPISDNEITVDSPIPFSIRDLWYYFDRRERVTYNDMARTQEALILDGNADTLTPAQFTPPGAGSAAPFKPSTPPLMGGYVGKIHGRLRDKRYSFLLDPTGYIPGQNDLHDLLQNWIGHPEGITVFDLAGVPSEVTDVVVGTITRILFESMLWGRDLPSLGKQRPVLLVYEEAHSYLPRGGSSQFVPGFAGRSVRRVLKEGRKYGVGALVVSQRPSELDDTVLSQCGTFFALRLSNTEDQSRIRATVPEALAGLTDLLPAMRTGEALIVGEAVQIPSRVRLPLVEPRPKSDDPEPALRWREPRVDKPPFDKAVTAWRQQRFADPEGDSEGHG